MSSIKKFTPPPLEKLTISELTHECQGVAWSLKKDGTPYKIELPFTLPGDIVEAEIWRGRKRRAALGKVKNYLEMSPLRVLPRCKHFASCGGCSSQHIPYEMQLQLKEKFVKELMHPYLSEDTLFHPIIASKTPWAYRNKMEYTFSESAKGERFLGLILSQSRGKAFNLEECHLVDPWFAKTLQAVRSWWEATHLHAYFPRANSGSLRTLTLRHGITTNDRMVILTVSGNPDFALKKHELEAFIKAVQEVAASDASIQLSIVLRIQQIAKGHPTQFYEMILLGPDYVRELIEIDDRKFEFHISPQAFFQPNTRTANVLYVRALELAAITKDSVVYDLYCGIGIFGMCAAHLAKEVIGVELSRESAYDAKTNSQRLGLKNFRIFEGDVGKVLHEKKSDDGSQIPPPDIVIVDPPRSGLDSKAITEIIALKPKTIVYVSCNPKTQAENMALLQSQGYRVRHVQPVDQFPHTPHVENIVILS